MGLKISRSFFYGLSLIHIFYTSDKPNELYTVEGLSSYVEEAVTSYNTEHGGAAAFENEKDQEKLPAALKSCSLEGQTGKLVFEYASADDFRCV